MVKSYTSPAVVPVPPPDPRYGLCGSDDGRVAVGGGAEEISGGDSRVGVPESSPSFLRLLSSAASAPLSVVADRVGSTTTNTHSAFYQRTPYPKSPYSDPSETLVGGGGGVEGEGVRDRVADGCGSRTTATATTTDSRSFPTTMNTMTKTTKTKTKANTKLRGTPSRSPAPLIPPPT